jgi:metal-responsive CopG/Arc/MetJ family transcriptional regulator
MAIRTTVEIPKRLHDLLRREAERSGSSVRSLMIRAVERTYSESGKSAYGQTRPKVSR